MTNEFAIKVLTELKGYGDKFANIGFDRKEALDMAIKALEQESVLDKIKAEIEALSNENPSYTHTCDVVDREDVIDIIDKYIEGSEENDE